MPVTYKTIVVHLDEKHRRAERLQLACALAARFEAHLVGLFALGAARIPSYALAEAGPLVRDIEERRRGEAARAAEEELRNAARRSGCKSEWRLSTQDAAAAVRLSARYADLVVLGQPEPGEALARGFVEEVILSAGRPVLMVPYAGRFSDAGQRALVAWNASREAARAVTDALPLLSRAQSVEVVAFGPNGDHGATPAADISLFLARHGVKATAARQSTPEVDIGSQILSRAADANADLIVMGAYGHSRLRELALGGATRSMLDAMTVPVLMAH
ncbi:MAG TPA: universal stress protein [Burkholderiales bacterium]